MKQTKNQVKKSILGNEDFKKPSTDSKGIRLGRQFWPRMGRSALTFLQQFRPSIEKSMPKPPSASMIETALFSSWLDLPLLTILT